MAEKNRVYESMTRTQRAGFTIRVWATETEFYPGPRTDVLEAIEGALIGDPQSISEALDQIAQVSAYEILDGRGNGVIVYPDWK